MTLGVSDFASAVASSDASAVGGGAGVGLAGELRSFLRRHLARAPLDQDRHIGSGNVVALILEMLAVRPRLALAVRYQQRKRASVAALDHVVAADDRRPLGRLRCRHKQFGLDVGRHLDDLRLAGLPRPVARLDILRKRRVFPPALIVRRDQIRDLDNLGLDFDAPAGGGNDLGFRPDRLRLDRLRLDRLRRDRLRLDPLRLNLGGVLGRLLLDLGGFLGFRRLAIGIAEMIVEQVPGFPRASFWNSGPLRILRSASIEPLSVGSFWVRLISRPISWAAVCSSASISGVAV